LPTIASLPTPLSARKRPASGLASVKPWPTGAPGSSA
jgi:hypothetical protein